MQRGSVRLYKSCAVCATRSLQASGHLVRLDTVRESHASMKRSGSIAIFVAEIRLLSVSEPLWMHGVGLWRSLVARPSGGRKVVGSNPASPTRISSIGTPC